MKEGPTHGIRAGDQFSGTLWDTLYKGQLAATFQNQLGVQAQVRHAGLVPGATACALWEGK